MFELSFGNKKVVKMTIIVTVLQYGYTLWNQNNYPEHLNHLPPKLYVGMKSVSNNQKSEYHKSNMLT